jgi:hypothetical protein
MSAIVNLFLFFLVVIFIIVAASSLVDFVLFRNIYGADKNKNVRQCRRCGCVQVKMYSKEKQMYFWQNSFMNNYFKTKKCFCQWI